MVTRSPHPPDAPRIRAVIDGFLQEHLQAKLDTLGNDERQALMESWIAKAAYRAGQIQLATHAIKYTHPDARGTNLSTQGNPAAGDALIGTHTLDGNGTLDVVGNAAALDVYKFLRLECDGKTLLARAIAADPGLSAALTADAEQAHAWMAAFAGLAAPKGEPSSHTLAKQVFWPLGDGQYHLLSPLFPTSLAHRLWTTIREDRFSDATKAARKARHNQEPHPHGYREYPEFAVQKFGGTNRQNISQLNAERFGDGYLLASVPPSWRSDPVRPPLKVETVFDRWFGGRPRVHGLTRGLRKFLPGVQDVNNWEIRNRRAVLVDLIRDELVQFAAELHDLTPGWSSHADCRLNLDERYWLDPRRTLDDETFAAGRASAEWRDAICGRFANWLNARLNTDQTPMGDPEHQEWHTVLEGKLRMLREELDLDD